MYEECTTWSALHVKDFFVRDVRRFYAAWTLGGGMAWSGDQVSPDFCLELDRSCTKEKRGPIP